MARRLGCAESAQEFRNALLSFMWSPHDLLSGRGRGLLRALLCGVALQYVHASGAGSSVKKPRLARELVALADAPSDFQALGFWPIRVQDHRAFVVSGPDSSTNSVTGIRALFPVTAVTVLRGHHRFVQEVVERLAPFTEAPLFPSLEVAGLRPAPGLVAIVDRSFISKRDALPLRRRLDGTLVVATVSQPFSNEELCLLYGAVRVEAIRISAADFREAQSVLPWGAPLRFA